jgi:AGZA family xanthine/uracil permease-like MFS transporter
MASLFKTISTFGSRIDDAVGASTFGRAFRLDGSGHEKSIPGTRFTVEVRAGLTTFFTMAYIIAVNVSTFFYHFSSCLRLQSL